jgi:hypothetical protein
MENFIIKKNSISVWKLTLDYNNIKIGYVHYD